MAEPPEGTQVSELVTESLASWTYCPTSVSTVTLQTGRVHEYTEPPKDARLGVAMTHRPTSPT